MERREKRGARRACRRPTWLGAACLAATAAGCGAPAAPRSLVRLLDEIEPARVVRTRTDVVAPRGAVLHRRERPHVRPPVPLVFDVALPSDETALVRARVRAGGTPSATVRLAVHALAEFHGDPPPAGRTNRRLETPIDVRVNPPLEALSDPRLRREWQLLELYVPPRPRRAGIAIELGAGGGALSVDSIEVESVPPWRRALVAPRFAEDRSVAPWRRIVHRAQVRVDCLVLSDGMRARWRIAIPATRPRLEMLLALCAAPGSAPVRLSAAVDGVPLETIELAPSTTAAVPPFQPRTIALDASAGREATLELSAAGGEDAFVLVGDPLLLGTPESPLPPSLVLISIDTLRADQVGCYGAPGGATPNLDRLAAEGARFARVVAASSWTLPSHATLFTGEPPLAHGAVKPSLRVDSGATPMLAELLQRHGYVTAAYSGGGFLDPAFGFAAGFDRYRTRDPCRITPPGVAGDDPLAPALDWLERHRDQPFFLFLHTYVVHDYAPLPEFVARVASPDDPQVDAGDSARLRVLFGATGDRDALARLKVLYRAALAQADERLVGRLLAELERHDRDETTVVSVVSDHGDQWLEHEGTFHNRCLWGELTSVPWIVRGPGVPSGSVVTALAGHADVAPTLLTRLGLAFATPVDGRDLLAPEVDERPVVAHVHSPEDGDVDALEIGPWKLLRQRRAEDGQERLRLYHRDRDPGERVDLAASEPEIVQALRQWLEDEIARSEAAARGRPRTSAAGVVPDPELEAELRELGYVTGDRP